MPECGVCWRPRALQGASLVLAHDASKPALPLQIPRTGVEPACPCRRSHLKVEVMSFSRWLLTLAELVTIDLASKMAYGLAHHVGGFARTVFVAGRRCLGRVDRDVIEPQNPRPHGAPLGQHVGNTGPEYSMLSSKNAEVSSRGDAESDVTAVQSVSPLITDPDLGRVVAAWSELPEVVRVGIVALVRASSPDAWTRWRHAGRCSPASRGNASTS